MVNNRGELISLDALCPESQLFNPADSASTTSSQFQISSPSTITPEQRVQLLDASSTIYADAFCEARAQGLTNRQASDQAGAAAARYIVSNGASSSDISFSLEWIQSATEKSEILCPELQPTTRYD